MLLGLAALATIFSTASGVLMWWLRRPRGRVGALNNEWRLSSRPRIDQSESSYDEKAVRELKGDLPGIDARTSELLASICFRPKREADLRMKTLVIDDEVFALKILTRRLRALGLGEVRSYERARDALRALDGGHCGSDLIFCDLQMPEMDGVEFIRHLVGMGYKGGLVLVSGEGERILRAAEKLARGHELKVLGTLQKPITSGKLQQVLGRTAPYASVSPRVGRKSYGAGALRRAISRGELINHYQPQADFASAAVTGVEALVRWRHPEDGLVFPDQFVHVAEESGLIDGMTRAVLKTALHDARRWLDEGFPLRVSVNVSMANLAALDFPDMVERAASDARFSVRDLMLEVTESQLMRNPLASLDILTRLRIKRISLSIDDFGTGHASFAQLRDIPFNELKVDRSFIHGAWRDASLRAIVEASLGMARNLGMKTVAEGVEDRDDWDCLRAIGCDLVQGWFIAKPMPADELPAWIQGWQLRRAELAARSLPMPTGFEPP